MDNKETVTLFRAVGFYELKNIMETGLFTLRPNGLESKYFGWDFEETLVFANKIFNVHVVAILELEVEKCVLNSIGDFTRVDSTVFKSGTVEVHKEHLDKFNNAVLNIKHVF